MVLQISPSAQPTEAPGGPGGGPGGGRRRRRRPWSRDAVGWMGSFVTSPDANTCRSSIEMKQGGSRRASTRTPSLAQAFRKRPPFPPKSGERGRGIGGKRPGELLSDAVVLGPTGDLPTCAAAREVAIALDS